MKDSVLIVLMNFSRPQNMALIIRAWKEQSVKPKHIVVVDNSRWGITHEFSQDNYTLQGAECYPKMQFAGVDDVWRISQNRGCAGFFIPALSFVDVDYVIFADDDFLPGNRAIGTLLDTAHYLENEFSTIGQASRNLEIRNPQGKRYKYGDVPQAVFPRPCNITCRSHLVCRDKIHHFIPLRNKILKEYEEEGERLVQIHNDILLCAGLQIETHYPSYIIPKVDNPECNLIREEIPEQDETIAIHRRPGHLQERNRFVDMCIGSGWKPDEILNRR